MKVLYLDPDEYYQQTLQQQTSSAVEVVGVRRGKDVFAAIRTHKPDALVMELFLEDEHGHRLLKQIRRHRDYAHIPVVVFSGLKQAEDMQAAQNLGINGFFVKGRDSIGQIKQALMNLS